MTVAKTDLLHDTDRTVSAFERYLARRAVLHEAVRNLSAKIENIDWHTFAAERVDAHVSTRKLHDAVVPAVLEAIRLDGELFNSALNAIQLYERSRALDLNVAACLEAARARHRAAEMLQVTDPLTSAKPAALAAPQAIVQEGAAKAEKPGAPKEELTDKGLKYPGKRP